MEHKLKYVFTPYLFFYKIVFEWILGFELPCNIKVGKGLIVFHFQAIVINENTIIGQNFTLRHSTTLGNNGSLGNSLFIGNNVNVGANVCIIGNIFIGDNVIIGAGSVVVLNVPSNCILIGNPARIIKWIISIKISFKNLVSIFIRITFF